MSKWGNYFLQNFGIQLVYSKGIAPIFKRFKATALKIGVLGVPFSRGQVNIGVEKGPEALREAGVIKELQRMGHIVKDYGDVCYSTDAIVEERYEVDQKIHSLPHIADCSKKVSETVQEILKTQLLLMMGGDHSIALGSVDGHMKAKDNKVSLLWVDAHADLNTADTSPSGNAHGMVASLLVKELTENWPFLPGFEWQDPVISIQNLAYIGLRSVDLYERVIIEKFKVAAFGMDDIDHYGIPAITRLALKKIDPRKENSLHISFDIDSLDSIEAPSTGTPVRGGLTLREAVILIEEVYNTGRLSAIDVVEINPSIGTPIQVKTTLEAAIQVIKAAFAHSRAGYIPENLKPVQLPSYTLGSGS